MGCPFAATEHRVRADILRQLSGRSAADLSAWDSYPPEVRWLAAELSSARMSHDIWPSAVFLPDDPADIPMGDHFGETDRWDFLPATFSIVEKEMGINMDAGFWDGLAGMTYAQAVGMMARKRAEQDAAKGRSGVGVK